MYHRSVKRRPSSFSAAINGVELVSVKNEAPWRGNVQIVVKGFPIGHTPDTAANTPVVIHLAGLEIVKQ